MATLATLPRIPLGPAAAPTYGFTADETRTLMSGIYARGDRLLGLFLLVHTAIALVLGFAYGTWVATFAVSAVAVAVFFASVELFPRSFLTRCLAGLSLQTFGALHLYQLHGLAEMQFFFFTALTMMIVYQDWAAMWPGAVAIIGQQIMVARLQQHGMALPLQTPYAGPVPLVLHVGLALAQLALCGYWAQLLRQQTLAHAARERDFARTTEALDEQLGRVRESEQKLRETSAQLREAAQLQRAILDNIPDVAWVKDAEGRILAVNRAFAQVVGLPADRLVGRTDADLHTPELAACFAEEDRQVVLQRRALHFTQEYPLPDGRVMYLEAVKAPILNARDEVVGTTGIARDVTARREAERELRDSERQMLQAQKLESIGVLAGGIAHDFNNLLLGILGNAGLARHDLPADSPVREIIADIETAAERGAELTRQMLAYSGKGKMAIGRVSLSAVVRRMAPLLESAVSKRAQFRVALATDVPLVEADARQIEQVILNLVTNASESLDDGPGEVTLTTGHTTLAAPFEPRGGGHVLPAGEYATLQVRDTGAGIPAATIARIFEPFYTTKFAGRGLGLPAVLGIVGGHGGAVDIESRESEGTTVTVHFPALPAAEPAASMVPASDDRHASAARRGRVLVVDDEEVVRTVVGQMVRMLGHDVCLAQNGREALETLRRQGEEIDLILLDRSMPGQDGAATVAELRRQGFRQRVVISSGCGEAEGAVAGAQGFIQKPYSLDRLRRALREAMEGPEGR